MSACMGFLPFQEGIHSRVPFQQDSKSLLKTIKNYQAAVRIETEQNINCLFTLIIKKMCENNLGAVGQYLNSNVLFIALGF